MKRIISLMLTAVLLLSCVSMLSVRVSAEVPTYTASDACIKMMKEYEGFCEFPMWDYGQWTVGYGTRCPDDKLAEYKASGIPKEDAEALFRSFLRAFEKDINERVVQKNNLTLTQNQFDALVSFSYNCGSGWAYDTDSALYQAVTQGITGTELIRSFALWCSAGGEVLTMLLRRRLSEANMYINGEYSRTPPENYCYVLYNANGGTTSPRTQGYDATAGATPYPVPEYYGYTFEGWYTERVGGQKVTELTAEHNATTLYAHWVDGNGDPSYSQVGNVEVSVTATDVNVRTGPGTNYSKVGTVTKGDKLVITATTTGGGYVWGKFDKGWMALQYTDYETVVLEKPDDTDTTQPEETTEPTTETTQPEETTEPTTEATEPEETTQPTEPETEPAEPENTAVYGTVKVNEFLRVRSNAGTAYGVVELLKPNQRVQILEQKMVGSVNWGRISTGWISMQYVVLDKTENNNTNNSDNTGNTGNTGTTNTSVGTGTVINCTRLRIRSGPGTTYAIVGFVDSGEKITFTEFKKVGSVTWGKYSKGWISLDYVKLDTAGSTGGNATGGATTGSNTTGGAATNAVTGTVKVNEWLRVRSGPGTSYAVAGYLKPNERVEITEQKTVGAITWGKMSTGWISMQYVELDKTSGDSAATPTTPTTPAEDVRTVNATTLYIRKTPGTGTANTIVGYLYNGTKVTILETKTVDGRQWGRISNGWICLEYTKK